MRGVNLGLLLIGLLLVSAPERVRAKAVSDSNVPAVTEKSADDLEIEDDPEDVVEEAWLRLAFGGGASEAIATIERALRGADAEYERELVESLGALLFLFDVSGTTPSDVAESPLLSKLTDHGRTIRTAKQRRLLSERASKEMLRFLDWLEPWMLAQLAKPEEGDVDMESVAEQVEETRKMFDYLRVAYHWRAGDFDGAIRLAKISKPSDDDENPLTLNTLVAATKAMSPTTDVPPLTSGMVIDETNSRFTCGTADTALFDEIGLRVMRLRHLGQLDAAIAVHMSSNQTGVLTDRRGRDSALLLELLRERYSRAEREREWRRAEDSLWINADTARWTFFGQVQTLPNAVRTSTPDGAEQTRLLTREELIERLRTSEFHEALLLD